jgi:primosomal protein N' (replication factor Y)
VVIYAPVPLGIARVANVERMQMLVESGSRGALQHFLAGWLPALHAMRRERAELGAQERILRWAVDVDPLVI